jgi:hypothetical protein
MIKDSWDIYYEFVCELEKYSKRVSGTPESFLPDWRNVLSDIDFDVLVFSVMDGVRQNCGSFADAVASFRDFGAELQRALRRFGFSGAAYAVNEAILLDDLFKEEGPSPRFVEEREKIDSMAVITYQRLVVYLARHHREFSVDILPMIEREGGLEAVIRRPTLSTLGHDTIEELLRE